MLRKNSMFLAVFQVSKFGWFVRPFSSLNSWLQILICQVQVVSQMAFGILIILAVAFLLVQRSSSSHRTMPITFILLLLGAVCGFTGKLCVDTLGGSGSLWLLYWEALCSLQFFSNVCTPTLFRILHGPVVAISQGTKPNTIFPYWLRKLLFYATSVLFLPLCCGLLPFAGPGEWTNHFCLLKPNMMCPKTGDWGSHSYRNQSSSCLFVCYLYCTPSCLSIVLGLNKLCGQLGWFIHFVCLSHCKIS